MRWLSFLLLLLLSVCSQGGSASPESPRAQAEPNTIIGFASHKKLWQHYQKQGLEFGRISAEQYLRMAQELRDRPLSRQILEHRRGDKVVSRFDRDTGAFIAFNVPSRIIRTFFRPTQGERYFYRQARRPQ